LGERVGCGECGYLGEDDTTCRGAQRERSGRLPHSEGQKKGEGSDHEQHDRSLEAVAGGEVAKSVCINESCSLATSDACVCVLVEDLKVKTLPKSCREKAAATGIDRYARAIEYADLKGIFQGYNAPSPSILRR
jgi:hypothetical protein